MYKLISSIHSSRAAATEFAAFAVSLLVAETFYKFHSFTLECVAFLATWYAASRLAALASRSQQ